MQTMTLNPRATGWEEQDAVTQAVPTGMRVPVHVRLAATCGQPCQATASFQGVIRVGLKGTVVYRVKLTKSLQYLDPVCPQL
ncbi:hypothetical protein A4R35_00170 [Thermogemmatispora tikiterensis]|uniref:Uncharacterized protein n=1 Tax=Thermogemmatispora tikiterensis TaxID=1825093 RepID=A0A328VI08_9CHLR|nr:hypothetical protein A4R35_00170 [Thermogemmatispora tikiterensis]